jgi:hypothetical protein
MSKQLTSDYSKTLEEAERQVSGIKDAKLREIAFSKLVSHLLDDHEETDNGSTETRVTKRNKTSQRKKTTNKQGGPKLWLTEFVEEGFFKKPKSAKEILEELETRSHHLKASDLTFPLRALCHDKRLRRKKLAGSDSKEVYHWSNW